MDNRKKIEDILLNDYGCFDDFTVDKLCDLFSVIVPKGTLCCPECNSTNLKNAIHTDYKECNKCYHYWQHNAL